LKRLRAVTKPVEHKAEGVLDILDSVYDSKKRKLQIYVPDHLEAHADCGLIQELVRLTASFNGISLERINKAHDIPHDEKANFFFMGYITELLSDQKIERVTYNKDSSYQIGRNCARTKIIQMVIDQKKIPITYLNIPKRYVGGTSDFKEPEDIRQLRTFSSGDLIEKLKDLLTALTRFVVDNDREKVSAKIGEGLFMQVNEHIHLHKRTVVRHIKTKSKSVKDVAQSIDPTKPSQLATVASWEKESIREVFDEPWQKEESFIKKFELIKPIDRNYVELGREISQIFDEQWKNKQKVLRLTRRRLELVATKAEEPKWKQLNAMREYLTSIGNIGRIKDYEVPYFIPHELFSEEKITTVDGFISPIVSLYKDKTLRKYYPSTQGLLEAWDSFESKIEREVQPQKK